MYIIKYFIKFDADIYQIGNLFYIIFSSEIAAVTNIHEGFFKKAIQEIGKKDGYKEIANRKCPLLKDGIIFRRNKITHQLQHYGIMQQVHGVGN